MLKILEYTAETIIIFYIVQHFIYVFAFVLSSSDKKERRDKKISILIAVRNEEKNVLNCLQSIEALDYPKELLDVHIGDDGSRDATAKIINDFIQGRTHFHYHFIDSQFPNIYGKQNALAKLYHHTKNDESEILLFIDADIRVKKNWASHITSCFDNPEVGIATAPTYVKDKGVFAILQSLEWLFFVFTNKALTILGLPVSAIGNNMAIRREAYESIGGFENIPFSITEDYQIFKYIRNKKWKFLFSFHYGVLNETRSVKTIKDYFRQRKRWIAGGKDIPLYILGLLSMDMIVNLALAVGLFLFTSKFFWTFFVLKILADFLMLFATCISLRKIKLLFFFPLHEIYFIIVSTIVPLISILPTKIVWKERQYQI